MGVKASLLLKREKRIDVGSSSSRDDEAAAAVVIVFRRLSPLDSDRINAVTKERGEGVTPSVMDGAEQILVPQIDSWNLEGEDGKPLPITAENICRFLPDEEVADLLRQITGRLGGEAARGEDENPTTTPSSISS